MKLENRVFFSFFTSAAFVILELVDIITEPFGLPDWTLKLVVVLLSIGLIVSVILSWIYDINPEGAIVKTEPLKELVDCISNFRKAKKLMAGDPLYVGILDWFGGTYHLICDTIKLKKLPWN